MDIVITPCCIHIICYVLSAILRKSMHASWWIYVDNVANMTHGTPLKSACVRLLGHVYGESGKALLNDIYIMELSALCHGKA